MRETNPRQCVAAGAFLRLAAQAVLAFRLQITAVRERAE